ncbi:hypothetical protein [Rhodococcus opacus]|uniref:Uncharacterized protein n=1 Tax=Rhodococcus opacus (strain B4) TaxID=632772 RepID=C1B9C0_RHOOB|nr:hypothetical protein [Rhodococcus opacus]BAH52273.1 hypothetical protein ROP_40260 [Rhodococcus opacus B4]
MSRWPAHLQETAPKKTRCRRCGTDIWTALHQCFDLALDPIPLAQLGELAALLTGARTYHRVNDHLYRRNTVSIANNPNPHHGTIHRTHHCQPPPPEEQRNTRDRHTPQDTCPY